MEKNHVQFATSLEIEPFKIRYLKHLSFTCYSSSRHNKGEIERGREGRDGVIGTLRLSERKHTEGLNK